MFSRLLQLSRFLSAHTSAFVILVGVLAFWQPGLFDWVRGNVQSAVIYIAATDIVPRQR